MNKVLSFILGAAAGSFLTWKLLEEKYKNIVNTELEAMDEYYKGLYVDKAETSTEKVEQPSIKIEEVKEDKNTVTKEITQKKPITYYYDKVKDLGYDIKPEDNMIITEEDDGSIWVEPGKDYIDPYVIAPEDFDEIEHYDSKSWTLYSDSVITNDVGEIVDEPEQFIGDCLTSFGEFEDDSLHVRNENLECDYEIIKISESFKDLNRGTTDDI